VQASLLFCLTLCGAFAAISKRPRIAFIVLSLNSFIHLILDALETKWGNGVHLFAPVSWKLVNFGLFWPDSPIIYALTILGLVYTVWVLLRHTQRTIGFSFHMSHRVILSVVLLSAYCIGPFAFLNEPAAEDNHSVSTLRDGTGRAGKHLSIDRELYIPRASGDVVKTFTGEELQAVGKRATKPGIVSIRGTFVDEKTVMIDDLRPHRSWLRNSASYLGLFLFVIAWIFPAATRRPVESRSTSRGKDL
jgi:hypothetical protein